MSFDAISCRDEPEESSSTLVVNVGEALDHKSAPAFKETCREYVDRGARRFVLDFSETSVLDSTGLGAIFALHRLVTPEEGEVVFAAVSKPVRVVVQLTRTYKVFRQFETSEEACQTLHAEQRARRSSDSTLASGSA